jgi:regulator of replication initiation timing
MARPRKISDADMIQIVDSFYESNGDPSMLKCSFLEQYAISIGIDIKAYDFRRNKVVRHRMEELKDLSLVSSSTGAIAYKSLDVDALLDCNRTKNMLRNALIELDETWRRIYQRAAEMSKRNKILVKSIESISAEHDTLEREASELSDQITSLNRRNKELTLENRYLKRMLKQYLYPAIANEILLNENVLQQIDTEVTQSTMDKMVDPLLPSPFSNSVASDRAILSREELLMERMKKKVNEEDSDA